LQPARAEKIETVEKIETGASIVRAFAAHIATSTATRPRFVRRRSPRRPTERA